MQANRAKTNEVILPHEAAMLARSLWSKFSPSVLPFVTRGLCD